MPSQKTGDDVNGETEAGIPMG